MKDQLLSDTAAMYSEISLMHVVSACKLIMRDGIPDNLEEIEGRVELLNRLGELLDRAVEAFYVTTDIEDRFDEDFLD